MIRCIKGVPVYVFDQKHPCISTSYLVKGYMFFVCLHWGVDEVFKGKLAQLSQRKERYMDKLLLCGLLKAVMIIIR